MRNSYYLGSLGDVSSIVSQLAGYTSDQIMSAFASLQQTFQSEQAELVAMTQWAAPATGNMQTLTPEGQQLYLQALQEKTSVVNGLQDQLSIFSSVLETLGIGGSAAVVPGLTGYGYGLSGLGVFPVVAGVIAAIIAIVLGVGVYEYFQSQSAQANAQAQQAKSMTQAQANVPALVAAGWTPQQIHDYIAQQQSSNQPSFLQQIPWKTLAIGGVLVVGIRAIFG